MLHMKEKRLFTPTLQMGIQPIENNIRLAYSVTIDRRSKCVCLVPHSTPSVQLRISGPMGLRTDR